MNNIQLKIEFEGTLRRLAFPKNETFVTLKSMLASLLGTADISVTYRDEEGDMILINSNLELQDILGIPSKAVTRLYVTRTSTAAAAGAPAAPEKPKLPFEDAANLLSNPEIVSDLLASVFTSAVVVDSITQSANLYLSTGGNMTETMQFVVNQLPLVQAVATEALEVQPELLKAFEQAKESLPSAMMSNASPEIMMNLVSQFFPMAQECKVQDDGSRPVKHFNVFCDGCESDPSLKKKSVELRMRGRGRGYILGKRFKSQTVHDFDLCESCLNSEKFNENYGPFEEMQAPEWPRNGRGGLRGWGDFFNGGPPHCRPHHGGPPHCRPHHHGGPHHHDGPHHHGGPHHHDGPHHHGGPHHHDGPHHHGGPSNEPVRSPEPPSSSRSVSDSSQVESDEWVKVQGDLMNKWATQLSLLSSLGFEKTEAYIAVLEEEKGDMEKVVNRIIRKEAE